MVCGENKLKTVILSGAIGVGLIGHANAVKPIKLELPVEKNHSAFIHEPVPHKVQPPGEFRDVDLPDAIKEEKQLLVSENAVTSKSSPSQHSVSKNFSIQVGVFKNRLNAERFEKKLLDQHFRAYLLEKKNKYNQSRYHIRIGHYQSREQAVTVLKGFIERSGMKAFIAAD